MTAWLLPLLAGGVTGSSLRLGLAAALSADLPDLLSRPWTSTRPRGSICSISRRRRRSAFSREEWTIGARIILPAVVTGLSSRWAHGLVVQRLDTSVLRKLFGLFLLYIGLTEFFGRINPPRIRRIRPQPQTESGLAHKSQSAFFQRIRFTLRRLPCYGSAYLFHPDSQQSQEHQHEGDGQGDERIGDEPGDKVTDKAHLPPP